MSESAQWNGKPVTVLERHEDGTAEIEDTFGDKHTVMQERLKQN